jgi:hypothetical protein
MRPMIDGNLRAFARLETAVSSADASTATTFSERPVSDAAMGDAALMGTPDPRQSTAMRTPAMSRNMLGRWGCVVTWIG